MRRPTPWTVCSFLVTILCPFLSYGQVNARLFRQPDVSATHITFVYAGDIWVVPKSGGLAQRLSSPEGEESFPRFSPDGSQIAYSANTTATQTSTWSPPWRESRSASPTTPWTTGWWTGICKGGP